MTRSVKRVPHLLPLHPILSLSRALASLIGLCLRKQAALRCPGVTGVACHRRNRCRVHYRLSDLFWLTRPLVSAFGRLWLPSIATLDQEVARFAHFARAHGRRRISPGIANIGEDVGDLLIVQQPAEFRHGRRGGRLVGADAQRAAQHHMHERSWIGLLDHRGTIKRGEKTGGALAVRPMAAGALVGIDIRADLHGRLGGGGGHARILIMRILILQIGRNRFEIGVAHVRG